MRRCGLLSRPLLVALVALVGRTPHGGHCAEIKRPRALPSYITACPFDDHIDDCGMKMAQKALPDILKGDPGFGLPPLDPMVVPRVQVKHGGGGQVIELDMQKVEVTGFNGMSITGYNSDLPKGRVGADASFPRLQILSDYELGGKLGALELQGHGRANITLVDIVLKMGCVFHLLDHDNVKYMHIDDIITTLDASRVYFDMGNKFGESPLMAEAVNLFLNDNWREVLQVMGPPILQTIKAMVLELATIITDTVPYNDIFPGAPEELSS